jgi:hypothetical protein
MSEPFPAELEEKAREFIGSLKASLKVRRYAEAYLNHLVRDEPEPREFKAGLGQPSFNYLRMRIQRIVNGEDT